MCNKFILGICQMKVGYDKNTNIKNAVEMLKKASEKGANIAVLPEMFNCPYDNNYFLKFSETIEKGETVKALSNAAKELGIYVVAGSIPEIDNDKLYNTSMVFDKNGILLAKHRKIHLFNINIPGNIVFKESDTFEAGNEITIVDTQYGKIGIAICYDIRFPEIFRLMSLKGAKVIIVPAAFNMVTGPAHWKELIRIRAVDNQVFLAAAAPARDDNASYVSYGHSMIVEPWGKILACGREKEEIILSEIDLERVEQVRKELPLLENMRTDLYYVDEK